MVFNGVLSDRESGKETYHMTLFNMLALSFTQNNKVSERLPSNKESNVDNDDDNAAFTTIEGLLTTRSNRLLRILLIRILILK